MVSGLTVRRSSEPRLSDGRQAQWVDVLGEGADPVFQLQQSNVGIQDGRCVVVWVNDFSCDAERTIQSISTPEFTLKMMRWCTKDHIRIWRAFSYGESVPP